MGLFSKLLGKEVKEEVKYDISDSQIDPEFVALYEAVNEFYDRLFGKTDKDPFELLKNLLVESSNAHELLFSTNDKASVSVTDVTIAACALVSYNGDPSDEHFKEVHRVISTSISAATDGEEEIEYDSMNVLLASYGLKGIIESI